MSVKYAPSKLRVPPGFQYLLEALAREVLREQPENIIQFADNYFKLKLKEREAGSSQDAPSEGKGSPNIAPSDANNEPSVAAADNVAIDEGTQPVPAADIVPAEPASKEEEEAAVKIQSLVRGAKARKEVGALKASSSTNVDIEVIDISNEAPVEPNVDATAPATDAVEDDTPAKDEPTPVTETGADDEPPFEMPPEGSKSEEELLSAATKIQATFRGHKSRKEVEQIKSASQEIAVIEQHALANTETVTEMEDTPTSEDTTDEAGPTSEIAADGTEIEKNDESAVEAVGNEKTDTDATTDTEPSDTKTDVETTDAVADAEIVDEKTDAENTDIKTDTENSDTKTDTETSDSKTDGETTDTKSEAEGNEKTEGEESEKTEQEDNEKSEPEVTEPTEPDNVKSEPESNQETEPEADSKTDAEPSSDVADDS